MHSGKRSKRSGIVARVKGMCFELRDVCIWFILSMFAASASKPVDERIRVEANNLAKLHNRSISLGTGCFSLSLLGHVFEVCIGCICTFVGQLVFDDETSGDEDPSRCSKVPDKAAEVWKCFFLNLDKSILF